MQSQEERKLSLKATHCPGTHALEVSIKPGKCGYLFISQQLPYPLIFLPNVKRLVILSKYGLFLVILEIFVSRC
jgi:hypothetical protein